MADTEVSLSPAVRTLHLSPSHAPATPPPASSSSPTTFSCPSSPSSASSSSSSSTSSYSESSSDVPAHRHYQHHHPRPQLQLPPSPVGEQPSSPSASPRSSSPSGSIGSSGSLGSSTSEGIGSSGASSSGDPRGPSPPLDVISEDAMEMDLGVDQGQNLSFLQNGHVITSSVSLARVPGTLEPLRPSGGPHSDLVLVQPSRSYLNVVLYLGPR